MKPKNVTWKKYLNSLTGKKRLLGLADYIEGLRWRGDDGNEHGSKPRSFHMSTVSYHCKSPACIVGHAGYFADAYYADFEGAGAAWLGLDTYSEEFTSLCYPLNQLQNYNVGAELGWYTKVSPKIAAKAIRRFARGERDPRKLWKEALK